MQHSNPNCQLIHSLRVSNPKGCLGHIVIDVGVVPSEHGQSTAVQALDLAALPVLFPTSSDERD